MASEVVCQLPEKVANVATNHSGGLIVPTLLVEER
jgi:hypothetical protein